MHCRLCTRFPFTRRRATGIGNLVRRPRSSVQVSGRCTSHDSNNRFTGASRTGLSIVCVASIDCNLIRTGRTGIVSLFLRVIYGTKLQFMWVAFAANMCISAPTMCEMRDDKFFAILQSGARKRRKQRLKCCWLENEMWWDTKTRTRRTFYERFLIVFIVVIAVLICRHTSHLTEYIYILLTHKVCVVCTLRSDSPLSRRQAREKFILFLRLLFIYIIHILREDGDGYCRLPNRLMQRAINSLIVLCAPERIYEATDETVEHEKCSQSFVIVVLGDLEQRVVYSVHTNSVCD